MELPPGYSLGSGPDGTWILSKWVEGMEEPYRFLITPGRSVSNRRMLEERMLQDRVGSDFAFERTDNREPARQRGRRTGRTSMARRVSRPKRGRRGKMFKAMVR